MRKFLSENRKWTVLTAVALICALLTAIVWYSYNLLAAMLRSQNVSAEFRGESEELFAQVSAFFPVGGGTSYENVYNFRSEMDSDYIDASLEATPRGSLYKDGYSGKSTITVKGNKATADCTVYGVGGDYFFFHPLYLRSGAYFSESDLVHDGIIIDEELAWRLFGGIDLAGMSVTINDEPFRIVGVVRHEEDFATKSAYSDGAVMYMHYDALNKFSSTLITTYEIVGADPIDGFLKKSVSDYFTEATVVENSGRFSVFSEWEILKGFFTRAMVTEPVVYPYWENAARYVEGILAVLLIFGFVLPVYPVIFLIIIFKNFVQAVIRSLKNGVPVILDRISERNYKRKLRKKGNNG